MIKEGMQDFIAASGAEGCYALTLCRIAAAAVDRDGFAGLAVTGIERGVKAGYIQPDMTVLDGAAFGRDAGLPAWTRGAVPGGGGCPLRRGLIRPDQGL